MHEVESGQFSQYVFLAEERPRTLCGRPAEWRRRHRQRPGPQRYLNEDFAIVLEEGMAYGYTSTETIDARMERPFRQRPPYGERIPW